MRFGLNGDDEKLSTRELKSGIQDEINATIDTRQRITNTYRFFAPTTAMLWDRLSMGCITYKRENLEIQTVTDPFTKPLLLRFTCLQIPTSSSQLIDAIMIIIKHNDKLTIVGKAHIDGTPGELYRDPNIENLKYLSAHAMTGVPSQEGKGDLTSIIIQFISAGLLVAVAKLFHGFAFTREAKADFSYRNALTIPNSDMKIVADFLKDQQVGTAFPVRQATGVTDDTICHPGVISKDPDVLYFRIEANSPYLFGQKIAKVMTGVAFKKKQSRTHQCHISHDPNQCRPCYRTIQQVAGIYWKDQVRTVLCRSQASTSWKQPRF
jgi:hypothetical protein